MKKLLHNNKAFTLIEVITTITILSIIMAIAVGSIDGLVKNSKKKAMKASAGSYVDAINLAIVQEEIENSNQVLEGSIYQEYMKLTNSLDQYSDVYIENGILQKANFCFEDGLVTYSNGKYSVYLNDNCKQSVISDTVSTAYDFDIENKTKGIPVFVGDKKNTNASYEEEPYKLYLVNNSAIASPVVNNSTSAFCNINNNNCDYRCIGGNLTYDEKGYITGGRNTCDRTSFYGSATNQGEQSLSWALSLGYSIDSYLWLRNEINGSRSTSKRHLDYVTSSDGFNLTSNNPYLYKSFCDNYTYGNSQIISNYCNNLQLANRKIGSSSNYLKSKHIFMNGVFPYKQVDFAVSLDTNIDSDNAVKDSSLLSDEKVNYDVKEFIKYGAVDFDETSNVSADIEQKINNIKKLVSSSGGVIILVGYGEDFEFYDKEKNIIYQPISESDSVIEQAVTIIGWDNNKIIDGKRGAWIAVTSNGSYLTNAAEAVEHGVNKSGFTYVSYYDYGYLSNEHYAFTNVQNTDNKNMRVYSTYNSSYNHVEGSASVKLQNVINSEYATNLVYDRIDSENYNETINQIKIYNQFSIATAYKVYLKQNEIYKEIGYVYFNDNESGLKTIDLSSKKIELTGETIDIIVTVFNQSNIENLVLSPEDFAIYTKTELKPGKEEVVDIKLLDITETRESGITNITFSILTNNIPTGEKIEFVAEDWSGKKIAVGGGSTNVINDFATARINFTNPAKIKIKVMYSDTLYETVEVNEDYDDSPKCSFSQSKVTLYGDSTSSVKLTCKDDRKIVSRKLSNGLLGPLTINTHYAKITSVSAPSCSLKVCTWTIYLEGNRMQEGIPLSLVAGAVKDSNGASNAKITTYVTVK